jgi:peptide/nickel transport system substrate-binding protein
MTRRHLRPRGQAAPRWHSTPVWLAVAIGLALCLGAAAGAASEKPRLPSIVIGIPDDPPNLDVQLAANPLTSPLVVNVYEALTKLDATETAVPALAESWKKLNPTTWRFQIRKGIKFQNGEAFNPAAAVFNFTRALVPTSENVSYFGTITGATVSGKHSIDVHTSAPDPNVPRELAFLYMVPPQYVQQQTSAFQTQKAIGTGPYLFSSWSPKQSYTFTRNPNYWGPDKATWQTITFRVIPDSSVRLQALRAGEIQLTRGISADLVSQAPKVRADIVNEVCLIRLNTLVGPFTDVRLRKAANMAIDRKTLIKALYGRFAQVPHAQLVTPASFGYSAAIKDYPYDVAQAKSLVGSSGYSNQTIQLVGRQGRWPNDRNLELAVTNMLQQVGLNVQLTIAETAVWRAAVFNDPRPDAVFYCTSDDTLNNLKVLEILATPTGAQSLYRSQSVATAIARASMEFNDAKRAKLLSQIWTQIREDAAFLPLLAVDQIWAMAKDVQWKPRHDGLIVLNDVKLVATKK